MKRIVLPMLVVAFGLLGSAHGFPSHDEGERRDCRRIRAKVQETFPGTGNESTGVISGAGPLVGTEHYVFDTAAFPTPDPNVVTFGAELTITTQHGVVMARAISLYNFVTGIWTQIATIDPDTSTGVFAGAAGTLWYPNGTTLNLEGGAQTYLSDLTGEVCLARSQP